ncbi:MAG: hypothetical protein Q7S36_02090, partial [Candidatus Liptonbacteria bacterium]|nr:hypothetical protein [Candidatus Liptonbacteria bacterium]
TLLVFTGWLLSGLFARATITIDFEEIPWEYSSVVLADPSVSKVNAEKGVLPAELFETNKNLTHLFPASAVRDVEQKAKGRIWIYNAFSSADQMLVATTRFETPNGKVFRILENITVPGAEIKDGKIIPSSIETDIVADKPGETYNVGPVARLAVPGFKGTPRYQGFYGELKNQTSGGFIGKKPVPTADDIKKAKEKTEELLRAGLETSFTAAYPKEYKILDGASRIEILRLTINQETDAKGNFSVFGEAKMSAFGFKEEDLRGLLVAVANKSEKDTDFKELELEYSGSKPDFSKEVFGFTVSSRGSLWPKFSPEDFKAGILGKKVGEAQLAIAALPRFSGGKVALWPIWLKSVPRDPEKVEIIVE